MSSETITCTLDSGATVFFDVTDTSAEDHDETHIWYEIFAAAVGG